ncbi:flagellar basal-body MS-ring/collar protein FliF [Vagococcus penaei]
MLQGIKDKFLSGWLKLSTVKKVATIATLISIILVIGLTLYFSNKTTYKVLFSDLGEAESGVVIENLESKNIKYKLENNGTKILIDETQVDKARIDLAVENKLPSQSTGFEIFDDKGMMTTDEDRKIMYQRAVTGELERSIESLDSVKKAKVMLVLPDRSIFEEKDKEASASIVLTLEPTAKLSDTVISGIANLTSGAVENLPLKNIKIVDDKGNTLSSFLDTSNKATATDLVSKYQAIKSDYEKSLEEKTLTLLSAVFDPDKVKVSVNTELDFDSIERTTVTYGDTKIRSENVQATGNQINRQEVQGGNVNDNVENVVGNNNNDGKTFNRSVNNEVDTETVKVLGAPGAVKKITASVLINGDVSNVERQRLEQIVQSAIGFDRERGDNVTIQGMNFAQEPEEVEGDVVEMNGVMEMLQTNWIWLALGGILAVITPLIIWLIRRRVKQKREADLVEPIDLGQKVDLVVDDTGLVEDPLDTLIQTRQEKIDDAQNESLTAENKAKEYAKSNPELAAELIKVWMKEK